MDVRQIQQQYQNIISLLKQKRLKEAQSQLEAFLWDSKEWTLRNRLEQAQTSYQYLLQYMKQGVNDPERQKLYTQLLVETWAIADQARLTLMEKLSTSIYFNQRNSQHEHTEASDLRAIRKELESFTDDMAVYRLMPAGPEPTGILERHDKALRALFMTTWANSEWSAEEALCTKEILASEQFPVNDLCIFTSAVMLSQMECFDARKFSWLLEATHHRETMVSQRALVGFAILLHIHADRLTLYPELTAQISIFNKDGILGKQLNRVYIQLLLSQETEKVVKKMREEIIPEMVKDIVAKPPTKFDEGDNAEENDLNPDWEKMFVNKELSNKIREVSELQLEGADVYMSTLGPTKHLPFFNELMNWFYPFDFEHPDIVKELGNKPSEDKAFLSEILNSGFFCDSDKYSLSFIMSMIPKQQRAFMLSQLAQQDLDSLKDQSQSLDLKQYAQRPEIVSNKYIHDLYRFFKLNKHRLEFRDIFKEEIALHSIPVLKDILCLPDLLKNVADFLFGKEHPAKALKIYEELIAMNATFEEEVFQKAGYCLQKEKRYEEAIEAFRNADVRMPDHIWTIRHLATCYRMAKDYATAIDYYKKAEAIQPDNSNLLFYIGSCFAELGQYEEALQYFFKLDYIESNDIRAWRGIGWCSFACSKYDQAKKYYGKVLASQPNGVDYLNAGHVAWKSGQLDKAVEYYNQSIQKCDSKSTFIELFYKDKHILLQQGILEEEMPLVLDMLDNK